MKQRSAPTFFMLFVLFSLALSGCVPLPAAAPVAAESSAPTLATAKVVSTLSNQPGRAFVAARGNHFVIDSVPPLEGPNEEVNPFDILLGALGTCGVFIYESAAQELNIPLNSIKATVEGDFMPAGVKDGSVTIAEIVRPRLVGRCGHHARHDHRHRHHQTSKHIPLHRLALSF